LALQMCEQGLALDSELLRELVDPDLSHISPVSVRPDRGGRTVVIAGACSSLSTHRVLIAFQPALVLLTDL
jgi:hypothetical protein